MGFKSVWIRFTRFYFDIFNMLKQFSLEDEGKPYIFILIGIFFIKRSSELLVSLVIFSSIHFSIFMGRLKVSLVYASFVMPIVTPFRGVTSIPVATNSAQELL